MEVKHIFQEHEAFCGPAVAQMVLGSVGVALTQQEIAKELETDMVIGTSVKELEAFLVRRGFRVERKNDATWSDLSEGLAKGMVVIGYIEPEGDPHYALVREVDEEKIILADPWHGDNFVLNKEAFLSRWVDTADARYGDRMLLTLWSHNTQQ